MLYRTGCACRASVSAGLDSTQFFAILKEYTVVWEVAQHLGGGDFVRRHII
jgi:hypothetical protein